VAVAAVGSAFTVADVAWTFTFAVVVGVGIGVAVGWLGVRALRFTETPVIENTVPLILPFAASSPPTNWGRREPWPWWPPASSSVATARHR
jgi:NhaP-type Na+/H+ or K+/H+ antiporter